VVGNPGRVIGWRRIGQGGKFETVYLPKLRDLAAARDIERVREHYGESIPEQMAVDLVEAINVLTQEMA
jgi:hypothetical protein